MFCICCYAGGYTHMEGVESLIRLNREDLKNDMYLMNLM